MIEGYRADALLRKVRNKVMGVEAAEALDTSLKACTFALRQGESDPHELAGDLLEALGLKGYKSAARERVR